MSDCNVCIGSYDYDFGSEFFSQEHPKARKKHKCIECKRVIPIGEKYEKCSGKYADDFFSVKTCIMCKEIRDSFNCDGSFIFGELWSDMASYVFPVFNTTCLARLQTPETKRYLQAKWIEWKGLKKLGSIMF
jgi:hypothetical protein